MKNENRGNIGAKAVLTLQNLQELRKRGFQYVRVNAFSLDKRPDYMEPHYIVLVPMKELSDDADKKGIYEAIDSPLLKNWANFPDEGIKVFVLI